MGDTSRQRTSRRAILGLLVAATPFATGCMAPWFRGATPEEEMQQRRDEIRTALKESPRLIADIAFERELTMGVVENVGLVTGLVGTGGPVKPSQPRDRMIDQMRRNDVKDPNHVLDGPTTTMVIGSVAVPPAARKGAKLDVVIDCSQYSEAADLEHGWLLETPLMSMSRLGGTLRRGFKSAVGGGQIVTLAQVSGSDDPAQKLSGSIIGGATFLKERDLGLSVEEDFADAITMAAVLPAINKRFTVFDGREHVGVATPLRDDYVKLTVPGRYRLDPYHFVKVVLHIGFNEDPADRAARLAALNAQAQESLTAQRACWQLEAIGEEAIPTLAGALSSPAPDVRFFAAHSLAYLDSSAAIEPLKQLSVQEPAFRAMALNALAITDHMEAELALRGLLHSADSETRYGAVRALRMRDSADPQVTATQIGDAGGVLEIPTESPPLIAVSLTKVPEIVIFGSSPPVVIPNAIEVNPRLHVKGNDDGTYTVTNQLPGRDRRVATAAPDLRSLLTSIAGVGGNYGDWVSFVRILSQNSYIAEPVAFNPVPTAGREYARRESSELEPGEVAMSGTVINEVVVEPEEKGASWMNPTTWFGN
ncbi:MAG: flagellar basal body P-ring protein FlgI [Aureliella sp.]